MSKMKKVRIEKVWVTDEEVEVPEDLTTASDIFHYLNQFREGGLCKMANDPTKGVWYETHVHDVETDDEID